jgi:hypothetical protein
VALDRHGHEGRDPALLLPAGLGELSIIEIATDGEVHRFERGKDEAWVYHGYGHSQHAAPDQDHDHDHGDAHEPAHAPDHHHEPGNSHHHESEAAAQAETIGAALAALARARIERQLGEAMNLADYGLANPEVLLNIYGEEHLEPLARYAFGAIAPDTGSRYVMLLDSDRVVTIPDYQIENLTALILAVGTGH